MSAYLRGISICGDMGTGGAPSASSDEEFSPGSGGTLYTDARTIRAVQQALVDRKVKPPPGKVDGVFGPKTEASLYAFTGRHGPPDDDALGKLGVKPGGAPPAAPFSREALYPRGAPAGAPVPPPPPQSASFWARPLWKGAEVKVWQAGLGGLAGLAVVASMVMVARR